jgi:hypothetical protein
VLKVLIALINEIFARAREECFFPPLCLSREDALLRLAHSESGCERTKHYSPFNKCIVQRFFQKRWSVV